MRWRRVLAIIFLVGFSVPGRAADEADRELSIFLAQHGYCAMHVDNSGQNTQIVESKINGKKVSLQVDTGCWRTTITVDCARHLKLDVHDTGKQDTGVGGIIAGTTGIALINSFTLNNFDINRLNTIKILPPKADFTNADGLLGFDYLHLNAVLLPVGGEVMLFRPGTAPLPSIDTYMDRMGFKSIPLHYVHGELRIEGQLNGHPLTAIVDCGATYSTFDLDYVQGTAQKNLVSLNTFFEGLDRRMMKTLAFYPKDFELGSLTIKSIGLQACEKPGFATDGIQALIGYDVLGHHDAILDLGHDVLWMK